MALKSSRLYIPTILLLLSLLDLRTEIKILLDHLTLTSLIYTVKHHILAVSIIISSPSLFKVYSKN